jgi:hypothetical protein
MTVCFHVWRAAPTVPPRTGQGAEDGCVRPDQAVLVEGAAGGGERGDNGERELARRD